MPISKLCPGPRAYQLRQLQDDSHQSLNVVVPLYDTITKKGAYVTLTAKVNGYPRAIATWYKDGEPINSSERIIVSAKRNNYILEIFTVQPSDHGFYTVVFTNCNNNIMLQARLFVAPETPNISGALYVLPPPRTYCHVVRHLTSVIVKKLGRITLEAEFLVNSNKYSWYRNNELIETSSRLVLSSRGKIATLNIVGAQYSDSGVYTLLSKTMYGYISSMATVIVLDIQPQNIEVPYVEDLTSEEVFANEKEEVNLILKCVINYKTKIVWSRKYGELTSNNQILDYGDGYLGLRILNLTDSSADLYKVTIRNDDLSQYDEATFNVCLTDKDVMKPQVELTKPLESVLAAVGAKVVFHCTFKIPQDFYFYVVWRVGPHKVERSNHKFFVVCKGGDFLLYIPSVQPSMAGEVICEVRCSLPQRKSIFINRALGHVAILPPNKLDEEYNTDPLYSRGKIFKSKRGRYDDAEQLPQTIKWPVGRSVHQSDTRSTLAALSTQYEDNPILYITYCRFPDGYYYLRVMRDATVMTDHVLVYEEVPHRGCGTLLKVDTVFEWDYALYPVTGHYCVELIDNHGSFSEVGVSTASSLKIEGMTLEALLKLRIRSIGPVSGGTCLLSINVHLDEEYPPPGRDLTMKDMATFHNQYSESSEIGSGAFGKVSLVSKRNAPGRAFFAAKFIKTRNLKRVTVAQREYAVMLALEHPRIVQLEAAFRSSSYLVLVMEYLWGGELFERIVTQEGTKEVDVIPYVRQICEGLQYLHSNNIVHLDIKPENIICIHPNSNAIKIVDFGLARHLTNGDPVRAIYGTKDYVSPEVLNYEILTVACDMWSMGVVTYVLLSGLVPFNGNDWPERATNIQKANYNYEDSVFSDISRLALSFVDQLLVINPRKRMTATQALNHAWMDRDRIGAMRVPLRRAQKNLKSYLTTRGRWQRVRNILIAAFRLRTPSSHQDKE